MADVYEQNLASKSTLTTTDYIRVVGSDNVSYKQLVSDVAKKIIENYTGSTLAGSAQSVKSAVDSLNSKTTDFGSSVTNLDTMLTTGWGYTNNATGVPSGAPNGFVICCKVSPNLAIQFYNPYNTANFFVRQYISNAWLSWRQI